VVVEPKDPALVAPRVAIERELRALLDDFPHTPVLVLSGLAEGVDTLAAEVTLALAADPRYLGADGRPRIAFVAALPLPLALCAEDFTSPAHVGVVQRLADSKLRTVEVFDPAEVEAALRSGGARREVFDAAYARLGAYVSRNCHLLIAVTDGRPKRADSSGGTADVIEWFAHGAPEVHVRPPPPPNPLRVPDGLRCIRIPCERASDPGFVPDPRPVVEVEAEKQRVDAILGRIDEFNEDAQAVGPASIAASELDVAFERGGREPETRPGPGRACAGAFLDARGVADALALRFQRRRRQAIVALFAIAALALLGFEFYAHGPDGLRDAPALLVLYVLGVLGSLALVVEARRRRVEAKYLVYRSFAESLRVQSTWRAVGLPDRADDHYSALHVDAIAWVRHGLKSLHVVADAHATSAISGDAALRWVDATWIGDQLEYFEGRVHRAKARLRACTWGARGLVFGGLGLAPAAFALHGHHTAHGLVLIAMVVCLAGGGFCRAWSSQMAYEATIDRYESAAAVFGRARGTGHRLAAGDRIELTGPLRVDPKVARERRVAHRRAAEPRSRWRPQGR